MCELVVFVLVVVKILAEGWTNAIVDDGMFEVPMGTESDVIGERTVLVVLHVSIVDWLLSLIHI